MSWKRSWHKHPAVRTGTQLSLGERAADHMRNGMGSWTFVFFFLIFMSLWALANSVFHLGAHKGFDPYPYILLNLLLSTMAGLQAAALLIAAKRADQIAGEIAVHTENNTDDLKTMLELNTDLTKSLEALVQRNNELTEAVERLTNEVHVKVCETAA